MLGSLESSRAVRLFPSCHHDWLPRACFFLLLTLVETLECLGLKTRQERGGCLHGLQDVH